MSTETRDRHVRLSALADQVLEAMSRSTGRDKSEIVREVLDEWASRKVHEANLIQRLAGGDGSAGSAGG